MLATIVSFLIRYLVFAMMLSIGLTVRPRELARIARRPRLHVRALLVMELGIPLLAMAICAAFRLPPRPTGLILLVAVCPGAPFIPTATRAKGEPHSQVGLELLVLCSLLAPLTVPLWVSLLDRISPLHLAISPVQVLRQIVPTVLAPLVLGALVRAVLPRVGDVLGHVAHAFFVVALVVAIGAALYLGAPVFLEVSPLTLLAILVVVTGSAVMGYWAAAPAPEARRVTAVAAALGNPGLALAIVAASYPGFKAAAFVAAYVLFRKLALVPFEQWVKHREPPTAHPPPIGGPRHAVGAT